MKSLPGNNYVSIKAYKDNKIDMENGIIDSVTMDVEIDLPMESGNDSEVLNRMSQNNCRMAHAIERLIRNMDFSDKVKFLTDENIPYRIIRTTLEKSTSKKTIERKQVYTKVDETIKEIGGIKNDNY